MASHANPSGSGPQQHGAQSSQGPPAVGHTSGPAGQGQRPTITDSGLTLAPGARPLPEYELVQLIGQGGFGQVWRARGPGGFSVALKFIKMTEHSGEVELRSLDVMREIRHPHLLGMFGAWQVAGYLVIAMELGDHTTYDYLNAAVKQGWPGVPPDKLMDFMRDAATGIDHLNSLGIQHRDIKPQNLLLVGGSVKVADFGLAKAMAQNSASHTGQQTLAYAAPEFFQGRVAATSDQYSLAVTYCHLRANRLPFQGGMAEMLSGHLMRQPDLSYLPTQAERNIVARALAKDPNHRWPNCREFVQAVIAAARPAGPPPMPGGQFTAQPPPVPGSTQAVKRHHTTPLNAQSHTQPLTPGALDPFADDVQRRTPLAWVVAGGLAVTVLTVVLVTIFWLAPWTTNSGDSGTVSDTARQEANQARVRGAEHLARKDYVKALAAFDEALKHNPKDVEAMAGRARVKIAQGQLDPAIDDCTKTLEIDPKSATAYQVRAEAHLAKVHLDQARTDVDKALELQPASVDALLTQARVLAQLTDFEAALRAADQAVEKAPGEARVWAGRADVHLAREHFGKAIDDLDRAVEKDAKNPDYLARRGRARVFRDGPGAGREDFEKAVKLWQPNSGKEFAERGRLQVELGRYKEALDDCDKAVDREPRDPTAFAVRADVYAAQGERTKALTERRNAIERHGEPTYAPGWLERAQLHTECGDYEKALSDCGEALKRAPRYAAAYLERCQLYTGARWDHAKALADVDEALRLAPRAPELHHRRALILVGLNNPEEAAKCLDAMAKTGDGDHAIYHARRAQVLLQTDQADAAADAARTALGKASRHTLALRIRGLALAQQGRALDGLRDLDQAIAQDPTDLGLRLDRATIYRQVSQSDKALADLEEYQRRSPHQYIADISLGQHYTAVYRYDDALAAYNRAVFAYPQGAEALLLRGKAHADQSKFHDRARQDFAAVLVLLPNLSAAFADRGLLCLNQGRYEEGVRDFEQALTHHKGGARKKAEYLNWQGRCLHENGEYTRAIEVFNRATLADPTLPYPYNNRALSLSSLGQHDKALAELERALNLKGDSALYHANKGYIYYQKRDYPNSVEAYTKALELEKNPRTRANYLQSRGDAWFDQKDYRRAAQDHREATRLDATKAMHFSKLGVALYWANDYDDAILAHNRALELETTPTNRATFYNRRGNVYGSRGDDYVRRNDPENARRDYQRALDDFQQAAKANDKLPVYHANVGWAYRQLKEEEKCVAAYTQAISRESDKATKANHYNYRGLAYLRQKKYDTALEDFKEAIRLDPREGAFHYNQGDSHFFLKQYRQGLDSYEEALKRLTLPKQRASAYSGRGWCQRMLGDKNAAIRDYTSAIDLDSGRAEFYKERASVYDEVGRAEEARNDRARAAELERK